MKGGPKVHFLLAFFGTSLGKGSGEALMRIFSDLDPILGASGEAFGLHFPYFSRSKNLYDFWSILG